MQRIRPRLLPLLLCAMLGTAPIAASAAGDTVSTSYSTTALTWQPLIAYDGVTLRVVGADGYLFERDFGAALPSFSIVADGAPLADGQYRYELVFTRPISPQLAQALDNARSAGGGLTDPALAAQLDELSATYGGSFMVVQGQVLTPQASESTGSLPQDQVVADDQIVQGSLCVGFDCVANENFSFDTLRLKENNTRIKFEDTSASAGFATNDWQLTANDSASGGLDKFSIEDVTGAKVPFTIVAGAASNSLYVDSSGRVGFGTSTPGLKLHAQTSDTPAFRLEQTNAGGFTAQTWDIAGNEANFFVRDLTGGSRLPLRIRPGAPTSSVDIAASGKVGIGTADPVATLDITRSTATDLTFRIKNSASSWDLKNNAATGRLTFTDDSTGVRVPFKFGTGAVDNLLRVGVVNTGTVDVNGTLTVNGTFNNLSSRELKDILSSADLGGVLRSISSLPLYTWSYKHENDVRHFGPVAEDFYSRFGLGTDEKHISPSDMAGVALAATQALNTLVAEKDAEIQRLNERLSRLENYIKGLVPGDTRH